MASAEELKKVIGCLTTVFPQFVSKELAGIADQITVNVQGFTDPLAAVAALDVGTLVDDVAAISEGDIFESLGEAAAGITAQYVKREIEELNDSRDHTEGDLSKRINSVRTFSKKVVAQGSSILTVASDAPYVAVQKMCEQLIDLNQLKLSTIECIKRHVTQLTNVLLVAAKTSEQIKGNAMDRFADLSEHLHKTKLELSKSTRVVEGSVVLDNKAFTRARDELWRADGVAAPDIAGTTVLDYTRLLLEGDLNPEHHGDSGQALALLSVQPLMDLVQSGARSLAMQVSVINSVVLAMVGVADQYRRIGTSPRVQDVRANLVAEISSKISDLASRVDAAIARGSVRAASAEMILWSSRIKAILVSMDRVNNTTIEPGSPEGSAKASELQLAHEALLEEIFAIPALSGGSEDVAELTNRTFALVKAVSRAIEDIENGHTSKGRIATVQAIARAVMTEQEGILAESTSTAYQMINAVTPFTKISIGSREQFESVIASMRQMGLDRGADLLDLGRFKEYMDTDMDKMSYLGVAIECLGEAMDISSDTQTRKEIARIRDSLIARRSNQEISAVDSADQGRTRVIGKLQEKIASIQKNAKTVEGIVDQLKVIYKQVGGSIGDLEQEFSSSGDVSRLQIESGGRLAGVIEEYSSHPNAGILGCKTL